MTQKIDWLNRLAKWRSILAGWQLGTRVKGDPESDAVRDHREATLLLRAEVSAVTALLINKGVFTAEEFTDQCHAEAEFYCGCYERKFPGMKAEDFGMSIDPALASSTMKNWRP